MAKSVLAYVCAKCGRRLPRPDVAPALCPKCELVNSLLVERYAPLPTDDKAPHNG